jgi:putative PIN family toxin of toxin-antitoxin system
LSNFSCYENPSYARIWRENSELGGHSPLITTGKVDDGDGITYDTTMNVKLPQVVIDTNVLISALRSREGASFKLLSLVGTDKFTVNISVALLLEYEEAAKRQKRETVLTSHDIDDILDYLCSVATRREIFFLWRPFLRDREDDLVLELAVEASCDFIVTYNKRDFEGAEKFGIRVVTPKEFLEERGLIP